MIIVGGGEERVKVFLQVKKMKKKRERKGENDLKIQRENHNDQSCDIVD